MARFGMTALLGAETIARRFQSERTRALFAGLAAHSFLALDEAAKRRFRNVDGGACTCGGLAYTPRRGAIDYECVMRVCCRSLGGSVRTSSRVDSLDALAEI